MIALLLLAPLALSFECESELTGSDLSVRLQQAERAYQEFNSDGFFTTIDSTVLDVPCLSDALSSRTVARLHRLRGVRLHARGAVDDATRSFAAANGADPEGSLPAAFVPDGHELWALSDSTAYTATTRVPRPARGVALHIDGQLSRERPTDRPALVQVVVDDDVVESVYLLPEQSMPLYAASNAPRIRRTVGWTGAGVSLLTAVTLFGAARGTGAVLRSGDVPDDWTRDDVSARQQHTNTLAAGSIASAVLAGGFTVLAVVP